LIFFEKNCIIIKDIRISSKRPEKGKLFERIGRKTQEPKVRNDKGSQEPKEKDFLIKTHSYFGYGFFCFRDRLVGIKTDE
jgi:hypothetical protein